MKARPEAGSSATAWAVAALCSALPFYHPVYNSDLFWHLNAGREILAHGRIPRAIADSFAPPSGTWTDFEWLSQAIYRAAYAAGGFEGLWLLKGACLAACAWLLVRALEEARVPSTARAAALAAWSAGALYYADARPELFSLALLAALLLRLETWRALDYRFDPRELIGVFAGFALWTNLHGAFPVGLIAIGCWLLPEALARRGRAARALAAALAAAVAGTFVTPFGLSAYGVVWEHARQGGTLARTLVEWQPLAWRRDIPLQPAFVLLGCVAALIVARLFSKAAWAKKLPWGLALLTAWLGASAILHMRMAAFFVSPAILLILIAAREADWLSRPAARRAALASLVLSAGFAAYYAPHVPRSHPIDWELEPVRAADFLEAERPVVERLRVFNEWQWGGYLPWRLPWFKVFQDGRYVFHDRLGPFRDALTAGPKAYAALLDEWKLDALLLKAGADDYPVIRYPDGRPWGRPWHALFLPPERWALVYRDDKSLFFVRRDAAPKDWIGARELSR